MIREEIENKLKNILIEILLIEESSINNDSNLVDDLQADSLDTVEIAMSVEDDFKIDISDEEVEMAITFGLLANLVESKIKE